MRVLEERWEGRLRWRGWVSGKEPALDRTPEAEGVAAISRSLVTSGWESGRAGETAAMLWNAGIAVGERLATSS